MVPPACSILVRAEADTVTPFTLNLRCTSPMPSSLIGRSGRRTSPAPNSVSGVTSAPSARWPGWGRWSTSAACLNGLWRRRLGLGVLRGVDLRRILVPHARLVVLHTQRSQRPPLHRGPPDSGPDLQDAQLALAGRRQRPVAARLALAVLPGGGQPSHGRPPAGPCNGSLRARRRAPWRHVAPW